MPLVSVIVPAYNHRPYLEQRLETVFGQTFSDYEVILLDDCSTDGSQAVLRRYATHPKVSKVEFNTANSGSTFRQWEKGIKQARGEWIWMAESDDFCDEHLLEALVGAAQAHKNTVLSYCQSYEVDEAGNRLGNLSWHTDKIDKGYWKNDYVAAGTDEIKKCLWHYNSIPNASAVLFKKEAYLASGNRFQSMKMCGDWMLWVQLLKQGDVAFCATPHNSFRKHSHTTRILTDRQKIRTRFEEEYAIAADIKATVAGIKTVPATRKLWRISREYGTLFTFREVFTYLYKPWTYKKVIPLMTMSGFFFVRLVKKRTLGLFRG